MLTNSKQKQWLCSFRLEPAIISMWLSNTPLSFHRKLLNWIDACMNVNEGNCHLYCEGESINDVVKYFLMYGPYKLELSLNWSLAAKDVSHVFLYGCSGREQLFLQGSMPLNHWRLLLSGLTLRPWVDTNLTDQVCTPLGWSFCWMSLIIKEWLAYYSRGRLHPATAILNGS